MEMKDSMAELDARIAARREALDKKLGLAPAEADPAESVPPASEDPGDPAPSAPAESAGTTAPATKAARPSGRKDGNATGKLSKVMDDLDAGLDFFGLFTIPGIIVKIVFVLLCLGAFFSLLWAVRSLLAGWGWGVSWWLGDAVFDAFLAWLLWWLCTHKKK